MRLLQLQTLAIFLCASTIPALHAQADPAGNSAAPPKAKQLDSATPQPTELSAPERAFIDDSRKKGTDATVLLTLTIDEKGVPQNVRILHGLGNGLDARAIEKVRQYRFKPAIRDGVPVPAHVNIEVNFKIEKNSPQQRPPPRTRPKLRLTSHPAVQTVPAAAISMRYRCEKSVDR